ncbi:MAG: 50S ribosomal protein L22 [Candidatus Desulfofervidaceae bacterium]|nr:50S ribosomal protein L22 [Candidatus Desulfofervidaceae bacterium]
MEARAVARYIRISPRKVRLVIDLVRGKKVEEALAMLEFTPKRAARVVSKLIKSAVANAEQNPDVDVDNLYIKRIYADSGPILKRIRPRAVGRAYLIRKRTSHITVILDELVS